MVEYRLLLFLAIDTVYKKKKKNVALRSFNMGVSEKILSSSEHRPHHQLSAALPTDLTPVKIPRPSIFSIDWGQGYNHNPKNLPKGVPAQ